MPKFTPGPWEVKPVFISQKHSEAIHFGEYRLNLWGITGRTTPEGTSPTLSRDEAEANAALITAAPAMYAALKSIVESRSHIEAEFSTKFPTVQLRPIPVAFIERAAAALKAARGEL